MIKRQYQTGLSLIELMIGIVLASIIVAGVLYIFNGSRASSLLIEAESKMLDEAQFSMENMNSVIRMAGYTMDPKGGGSESIIINPGAANPVPGDVVQGIEGGENPDEITVWYEGNDDGSVFDCHGETVDEDGATGRGILRSNHYFVEDGSLNCQRNTGTRQPLIDNVADLQILYGIDTNADPDGAVNIFKTFNEISATERLNIISIMLALTLEADVTGDTLENTFTSTIYLRNRAS